MYDGEIIADVQWTVRAYLRTRVDCGTLLLADLPEVPDSVKTVHCLPYPDAPLCALIEARKAAINSCDRKQYIPDGFAAANIDRSRVMAAVGSLLVPELRKSLKAPADEWQYFNADAVADEAMNDLRTQIDVILIACSHHGPYGDRNPFVRALGYEEFKRTDLSGSEIIHDFLLPKILEKFAQWRIGWSAKQGFGRFDTRE